MIIRRIHITQYQRALVFRGGDFRQILGPGTVLRVPLWDAVRRIRIEIANLLDTQFEHPLLDVLVQEDSIRRELEIVDLTDVQRALVWKSGRLASILGPGRTAYWKAPNDLRVEVFEIDEEARFAHERAHVVLDHPDAQHYLDLIEVAPSHEVLVFREACLIARAKEGRLVYWRDGRKVQIYAIDLREKTVDVSGQEIMTRDKVTLRANLAVVYRVADTLQAVTAAKDADGALYREAQLALRSAVGTRTLDTLLADKEVLGSELATSLAKRVRPLGLEILSVGLRDVILPGDMKTILNQVILAQKEAEANLIKRREETAAARSQANTARLLAENPVLARMKELEKLQDILAGAKTTFVFGGGELATQVRTLVETKGDE